MPGATTAATLAAALVAALAAALLATGVLWLTPAAAEPAPADAPPSKKARALAAKASQPPHHRPPLAPGSKPAKLINLHNVWTREWLAVDPAHPPDQPTVDHFLRDHFTNKPTQMQPRLLSIVVLAATSFRAGTVEIVSAYRHPKFNLILRKKGHQVARDSQHTHGNAIDFYLPGVPVAALHSWARSQKIGGVGYYPESGFVHMDVGPIRAWSGE